MVGIPGIFVLRFSYMEELHMKTYRAHYTAIDPSDPIANVKQITNALVLKNELGELVIEFDSNADNPAPPTIHNFEAEQCYQIKQSDIMTCSLVELIFICKSWMQAFDDYQQQAADKVEPDLVEEFVKAYNFVESSLFKLQNNSLIDSPAVRNSLRLTVKHYFKLAATI